MRWQLQGPQFTPGPREQRALAMLIYGTVFVLYWKGWINILTPILDWILQR